MWVMCLRATLSEFHFHFSVQQHQPSHGSSCAAPAALVQVLWFLSSAALHVLVCFLPSDLSFIKLHHTAPLSHSVFAWRFFYFIFFLSGFLEGVLGTHSTHSSPFQQTQLVLRPRATPLRLRPFALDSCSQTNHVGQQGRGGRGQFKPSEVMAPPWLPSAFFTRINHMSQL